MAPPDGEASSSSTTDTVSSSYGQHLRITVSANQGGRRYMEDRVHIECVRYPCGAIDYVYFAVYDGHGGSEASDFVRKHLLKNIQAQSGFDGNDEEMLNAIKMGFMETHHAMWKVVDNWPLTASGYTSTAGTTASCAFIRRGKIFTGHVGDSAIILGEMNGARHKATSLTIDHKPDNFLEERRINNAGGMVMKKSGITRVVWKRPIRGHVGPVRRSTPTESIAFLAVSRSLGDLWSYNRETKQFIVSPEPDVAVFELSNNEFCLVLGSDGLTNVLKPSQIIDIVMHYEKTFRDEHGQLPNHSRWLLRHALEGWKTLRADNISIITVMFDKQNVHVDNAYTIRTSNGDLNLEKALTDYENSAIILGPKYCQHLETSDVLLYYSGIVDPNFSTAVSYNGPGFTRDVRHTAAAFVQMPDMSVVPLSSLADMPAVHRLTELFGNSNGAAAVLPAIAAATDYPSGIILEPLDAYINGINGAIHYPRDEDVAREETVSCEGSDADNDDADGGGGGGVHDGDGKMVDVFPVLTNMQADSNSVNLKHDNENTPSTSSRKRPLRLFLYGDNDKVKHADAPSSSSNEQTLSASNSLAEVTRQRPVLSVRRIVHPRHSAPSIRPCSLLGSNDRCNGDDNVAESRSNNVRRSLSTSSYNGASALSPALMLSALRTTNQLFEHDPFTRDLIRAGRRLNFSPSEPAEKKLKVSDDKWIHIDHNYESRNGNSKKLEEDKAAVDTTDADRVRSSSISSSATTTTTTTTTSPTARSRFWDFISSFLGTRGSTAK